MGVQRDHRSSAPCWPFGISGDLPIAALRVEEERMEAALSLERIHQFLVQGGFMFDLVFLMREGETICTRCGILWKRGCGLTGGSIAWERGEAYSWWKRRRQRRCVLPRCCWMRWKRTSGE
ncbi:MAG: hypothetical protein ACLSAF_16610 [Intestinimonas sp.]